MTVPSKKIFCLFSVCNKISLSFYERKCLADIFFERWLFHLRATKVVVVSLIMKATVWIYLIIAEIIDQYFIFWLGQNVARVNFRLIVFLLTIYSKHIQSKTKCNFCFCQGKVMLYHQHFEGGRENAQGQEKHLSRRSLSKPNKKKFSF